MHTSFQEGLCPSPESSRTWQLWPYGSGFRVKDIRKGLRNLSLRGRNNAEGSHELEMALNGGSREAIV